EDGGGRLVGPCVHIVPVGATAGLGQRGAQAGDRLAVALGALTLVLDLAQEVLAVRAHGLELAEQRLVGGEPFVGRLARGRRGRGVLGLLAALGEARLRLRGARLRAGDLGLEARGAARLLVALRLGRLAPPSRGLRLAAQVLDPSELLLEAALA